jgi:hypothetical protein
VTLYHGKHDASIILGYIQRNHSTSWHVFDTCQTSVQNGAIGTWKYDQSRRYRKRIFARAFKPSYSGWNTSECHNNLFKSLERFYSYTSFYSIVCIAYHCPQELLLRFLRPPHNHRSGLLSHASLYLLCAYLSIVSLSPFQLRMLPWRLEHPCVVHPPWSLPRPLQLLPRFPLIQWALP